MPYWGKNVASSCRFSGQTPCLLLRCSRHPRRGIAKWRIILPRQHYRRFEMANTAWITPGLWGVAGGAVATMVIGFAWGGWVTGGTADEMAASEAEMAVVQAFVPLCVRSEEHTSELQSLMRISYAVF